jgi:UDP-N-acetylglucosamine--N-acetylmuramyl-(pentapeptide) pyrophosphoryl-undecaprenol N-acetylglucosamine transferase
LKDVAIQTAKTLRLFRSLKPEIVVGFGGYTSAPALAAAKLSRIPFVIHEQNAVLGRVNRRVAPYARLVALGFEHTRAIPEGIQTLFVGNPVRDEFSQGHGFSKERSDRICLFIFGGSQGAAVLNRVIPQALSRLPESLQRKVDLVMQVREELMTETQEAVQRTQAMVVALQPFFKDMAHQLAQADLIIARSGAMTVSEIATIGKAALFVPLKIAMDDHQFYNVKKIVEDKAAWLILEDCFTPEQVALLLKEILENPEEIRRRGEAIRSYYQTHSSVKLADAIENLI